MIILRLNNNNNRSNQLHLHIIRIRSEPIESTTPTYYSNPIRTDRINTPTYYSNPIITDWINYFYIALTFRTIDTFQHISQTDSNHIFVITTSSTLNFNLQKRSNQLHLLYFRFEPINLYWRSSNSYKKTYYIGLPLKYLEHSCTWLLF